MSTVGGPSLQLQNGGMPAAKSTTVTIAPARTVSQPMTTIDQITDDVTGEIEMENAEHAVHGRQRTRQILGQRERGSGPTPSQSATAAIADVGMTTARKAAVIMPPSRTTATPGTGEQSAVARRKCRRKRHE